jgi:predicted phosphoadenosine phosphosulfate sulfurtransferase
VVVADVPQNVVVAETVFFAVDEVKISHRAIIPKILGFVKKKNSNKINNLRNRCKTSCNRFAAVLKWGFP